MARRILVVGGGYAGALCAIRTARKTRAAGTDVVLVNASPWFVERIRLHEELVGGARARRPLAGLLEGTGVRLRVGAVTDVDLARRRVLLAPAVAGPEALAGPEAVAGPEASPSAPPEEEAFDDLVLATGSVVSARAVPGASQAWACGTDAQAAALRARLAELHGAHVVIVGGGLTGVELASELAGRRPDLRLTLVSSGEVTPDAEHGGRAHVRRVLQAMGVELHEHTRVSAVEDDAVVLASGDALPSDLTIWCGGFEAAPLARASGLAVDALGRALVDARLRSVSHDFIHVIGDAARVTLPGGAGTLEPLRMACATAMPQGAFCADDLAREIAGREALPFSFGFVGRCVSLGRRNGLIQLTDRHDVARDTWIGGRLGAFIKEMVCRYTVGALALERRGIGYAYPPAPALPASATALARAAAPSRSP